MPLAPTLPFGKELGPLKDLAQDVIAASATLEGRVAPETAQALGDQLRLLNSYYSNLIEGHRTFIPEILKALDNNYSDDDAKRYAQELCAAHVKVEKKLMTQVVDGKVPNVSSTAFLQKTHKKFFSQLPKAHQFTHGPDGFTDIPVMPGVLRDAEVAVQKGGTLGPNHRDLPGVMAKFEQVYAPVAFHGDERLLALATAHHRLTWLHPFRDGNGRVCRLHSGFFMAQSKINQGNLWSLSRGLSRTKNEYMVNLFSVDPAPKQDDESKNETLADFCQFFLEVCLDQINFMTKQLRLEKIEPRIEWFCSRRKKKDKNESRLLRAVFMEGEVKRGKAPSILNTSERTSRRIVKDLIEEGLLTSDSPKSPLRVALSFKVMSHYFPSLYENTVLGEEYLEIQGQD